VNGNEWSGISLTTTRGTELFALSVLDRFDNVLFDLDGTLYVDGDPLPGAQQFLEACISFQCSMSFVTNLSLWPKQHCLDALRLMGQSPSPDQVVTAVDVVVSMLEQRIVGVELGVVAAEHVHRRLSALGYHVHDLVRAPASCQLDAIVIGQVPELSDDARHNVSTSGGGAVQVFATATGGRMPTRLPGVFSAVQVLERVIVDPNVEVVNCGKPSDAFAGTIQKQLGSLERVLVVGDSLESDIALANTNGWSSLLLGDRPNPAGRIRPDYWAPSLAAITGS